jgi:hypothetical protein
VKSLSVPFFDSQNSQVDLIDSRDERKPRPRTMITPEFTLSQTENKLLIEVRVPNVKV